MIEMTVKNWSLDCDPWIKFEYLDDVHVAKIIDILQDKTTSMAKERRGFSLSIRGSCCKIPQGINWHVRIEFECDNDLKEMKVLFRKELL